MSDEEETFVADLLEFGMDNWSAFVRFMEVRGWSEDEMEAMGARILRKAGRS